MPNWSISQYSLTGNENEIEKLFRLMTKLEKRNEPAVKNGFGNTWLGCLVVELGKKWEDVWCRGEWSELECHDNIITLRTETAWAPANDVFDLICEKFPSISYYYYAEEPGLELYETNDSEGLFYPERYVVNIRDIEEEYYQEYFNTLDEALEWIGEVTGHEVGSVEEVTQLNDDMQEQDKEAYCYLHEIEIV